MKTYLWVAVVTLGLIVGTTAVVASAYADPVYENNGDNDHG